MRKFILTLVTLIFLGCAKKEIKIPVLAEKGIQEVHNHSQVWFFFEIKDKDTIAIVNRKNTISTTHWIFNIDKRLPLKTIIPSIITLQDKHANSMHSKEGMHNYFSYSDTISKRLSFLEFDGVTFKTDGATDFSNYQNYNNINLIFNPNSVWVDGVKTNKSNFKAALLALLELSSEGKKRILHLNFNKNLLYQDYLYYKTITHNLANENILINTNEFIFSENKV